MPLENERAEEERVSRGQASERAVCVCEAVSVEKGARRIPLPASVVSFWTLEYFAVIIHRAHKAIQGDDCRPRRRSWLRFPWLSPIRNSFELRGPHEAGGKFCHEPT